MALSVALIEPEIPPNTGNIARLCAATGTALHLIEPLGFDLDDATLARAGLHYMNQVDLWVHPYWRFFRSAISRDRCLYFSAHGSRSYVEAPFKPNSVLVFGNEGSGLPKPIIAKYPDRIFRIPMRDTVRNLNLATSVGIVVYEAIRQLGTEFDGLFEKALTEGG
jgi:tRNA (cytidine/uridine-2'-O-)-methyltransferase